MRRYFLFTRKDEANAILAAAKDNLNMAMQKESDAQLVCEEAFPPKPQEENIYEQLLSRGYSKQDIHNAMYKYMLLHIQHKKATGYNHTSLHEKPSLCSKATHFLKSLISAIVSFIKTQFAKKPKNPV